MLFRSSHWSNRRLRIVTQSSTVATQVVHAAGIAYAAKVRGLDEVAVTTLGEGSTSEGDWHEALNFAGVHKLPFICMVEDNDYAISVPHRLQMGVDSVARRAAGYGVHGETVDGGDILAAYEVMRDAVAIRPGVDWVAPYYRDLAFCISLGMTPADFMLSVFARAADPNSGGRPDGQRQRSPPVRQNPAAPLGQVPSTLPRSRRRGPSQIGRAHV